MSRAIPASSAPATIASRRGWPPAILVALVVIASAVAYLPAFPAGYIWDDTGHVTRADLQSLAGLGRIWFERGATQQYYPVLHSAFWIQHQLWGDSASGYHVFNVGLHALAACLFGFLLRRLAVPGAWFAALLFALHPVAVESVAWISEQKNTLSLVFGLGAALAYLRFEHARRPTQYAVATGLFLLALLTKSVTATLPAALLVLAWWQRGRVCWRRDVLPLLPWFLAAIAAGLNTAHFERTHIGAQGADFDLGYVERGLLAGRVIWFYLGKLIWPAELIFIYPRWEIDAGAIAHYLFPTAVLGTLVTLVAWQRRNRGPLAAFLLFTGMLFPVLGFFNVFPFIYSFVADHFQYHASLALFALFAAGAARLSVRWPPAMTAIGASVVLMLLGTLTWRQCGMYRDVVTLYEATLARNPSAWMAHNNLGLELAQAGRLDAAHAHLVQAIALRPEFAPAANNLGDVLNRQNRSAEALPHLLRALELQPDFVEARYNLGAALMALNRPAEGMAQFEQALRLRPDYAVAHRGLGRALATAGRTAEALPHFARAVELAPKDAETRIDAGFALLMANQPAAAIPHLQEAVRLHPDFPDAHLILGRALLAAGRPGEALPSVETALRLAPESAAARQVRAEIMRQTGRVP